MNNFEAYINKKTKEYGNNFDSSGLAEQFIKYFNNGQRIKVQFEYRGNPLTGTVGVTTGWKPSFILMRQSNSIGSPWLLGKNDKVIAVKQGKKYQEVQQ